MSRFAVSRRVDVLAASEHESVDRLENRGGGVRVGEWGDDEWYEPCTLQGVHVGGGEPNTPGIAIQADASGYSNCAGF